MNPYVLYGYTKIPDQEELFPVVFDGGQATLYGVTADGSKPQVQTTFGMAVVWDGLPMTLEQLDAHQQAAAEVQQVQADRVARLAKQNETPPQPQAEPDRVKGVPDAALWHSLLGAWFWENSEAENSDEQWQVKWPHGLRVWGPTQKTAYDRAHAVRNMDGVTNASPEWSSIDQPTEAEYIDPDDETAQPDFDSGPDA